MLVLIWCLSFPLPLCHPFQPPSVSLSPSIHLYSMISPSVWVLFPVSMDDSESPASILASVRAQEAQFELLSRALEEERRHVTAQLDRVWVTPQEATSTLANGTLTRRQQVMNVQYGLKRCCLSFVCRMQKCCYYKWLDGNCCFVRLIFPRPPSCQPQQGYPLLGKTYIPRPVLLVCFHQDLHDCVLW